MFCTFLMLLILNESSVRCVQRPRLTNHTCNDVTIGWILNLCLVKHSPRLNSKFIVCWSITTTCPRQCFMCLSNNWLSCCIIIDLSSDIRQLTSYSNLMTDIGIFIVIFIATNCNICCYCPITFINLNIGQLTYISWRVWTSRCWIELLTSRRIPFTQIVIHLRCQIIDEG